MAPKPYVAWYPANSANFTAADRDQATVDYIVIHVTQGSYASALNWFQNPSAGVSAHYTVRSSDGFIGQSVSDLNIAYHAGNYTVNRKAIGIEHEGFVSNSAWFTEAMLDSSARLAAFLCERWGIPINRSYIFGHNEIYGTSNTDPGNYWQWERYLELIRRYS